MEFFTHEFETEVVIHEIGNGPRIVTYTVVLLPQDMKHDLPFHEYPRLRVDAEIADHPFNGAWQPAGNGEHYLMVPKDILMAAELSVGSRVDVRFRIADQNSVTVPAALAAALESDAEVQAKWDDLSAGKRRGFAYRVASAKREATIAKRVEEVLHMVREGLSYGKR